MMLRVLRVLGEVLAEEYSTRGSTRSTPHFLRNLHCDAPSAPRMKTPPRGGVFTKQPRPGAGLFAVGGKRSRILEKFEISILSTIQNSGNSGRGRTVRRPATAVARARRASAPQQLPTAAQIFEIPILSPIQNSVNFVNCRNSNTFKYPKYWARAHGAAASNCCGADARRNKKGKEIKKGKAIKKATGRERERK